MKTDKLKTEEIIMCHIKEENKSASPASNWRVEESKMEI